VTALLSDDDRQLLKKLLKQLRGGKTKVLITSRSPEHWLTPQECYRLPLSGLQGEELWEYCNAVVADLGLQIDRNNQDFIALIKELDGHPLAIRAILLKLRDYSASALLKDLKKKFAGYLGDESTKRISVALEVFGDDFPEEFSPMLQMIGLHTRYVDRKCVQTMLLAAGDKADWILLEGCFQPLENSGVLQYMEQNVYRMHPALHHYLNLRYPASEVRQRAFVDFMGRFANELASKALHEQRSPFALHSVNFHYSLTLAQVLGIDVHVIALTHSLALYAQNIYDYAGASRLFENFAAESKRLSKPEWEAGAYHQQGKIAQEQRDYAAAEHWYKKALSIWGRFSIEHDIANTYHQLGMIAAERREYAAAERWYEQSLEINKKLGNEHSEAITYHQLGIIAGDQGNYVAAKRWYEQSLEIKERLGIEHDAAMTYFQLGIIAEEQRDYAAAERWYKQALSISKKYGNEHGAALTYHQLGMIAAEQGNYVVAERWYKQSLLISEKYGYEHDAALTYHQLGRVAEEQGDYTAAERWYNLSLSIKEKQGNEHGAALTYHQLGQVARLQHAYQHAAIWYLKALPIFRRYKDTDNVMIAARNYELTVLAADPATQALLRQLRKEAGLDQTITLDQLEQQLQ